MDKYARTKANREGRFPLDGDMRPEVINLPAKTEDEPCEHAKKYTEFATLVLETVVNARQLVYINRAKLLLTDQYFRTRRTLPIYHQDTTNYNGHPCIYQAYVAAYEQLEKRELEVAPPAFEVPIHPRGRKKVTPEPTIMDESVIRKLIMDENRV